MTGLLSRRQAATAQQRNNNSTRKFSRNTLKMFFTGHTSRLNFTIRQNQTHNRLQTVHLSILSYRQRHRRLTFKYRVRHNTGRHLTNVGIRVDNTIGNRLI